MNMHLYVILSEVLKNSFMLQKAPLLGPVWDTTQLHPLFTYFLKYIFFV